MLSRPRASRRRLIFYPGVLCNVGVGTRDYYRKLGYELDGPYMSKKLV